jgi:ABC-type nitrate/sulfonate/bicarbonate transport system substrate-binding protein
MRRNAAVAVTGLAAAVLLGTAGACADRSSIATSPRIRIGYAGTLDFSDMASELAHERLRESGVAVTTRSFPTAELIVDALARGDVDVADGSTRAFWAAAAKGAPIRTVMDHVVDVHRLVVAGEPGCRAIDGVRLALQSEAAAGTALARAYLARACPDARPDILFVPGSTNRMAALLSGSLTATVLQLSDVVRLERLAPGRVSVMADFAREWPTVETTGVHVNTRFAAAHPDWVRAYVRARLTANREIAGHGDELVALANRLMGAEPDWATLAPIYMALPAWDPNGGLTREGVKATLDFLVRHTRLSPALTPEMVADLSYLDAALRDLGLSDAHPASTAHTDTGSRPAGP